MSKDRGVDEVDAENRPMYMGQGLREWGREMHWEIKTATYIYTTMYKTDS